MARSDTLPVGFIQELQGTVEIWKDGHWTHLDTKADVGRLLFAEDKLRCSKPAVAEVRLPRKDESKRSTPQNLCAGDQMDERSLHLRYGVDSKTSEPNKALESYMNTNFTLGGRNKGHETSITTPPAGESLLPSQFVVHWRNKPPLGAITLLILKPDGTELAHTGPLPGTAETVDSDPLRKALESVQDDAVVDHDLRLVLKPESGPDQSVTFSLLTRAQEASVAKSLAEVEASDGLLAFIERAAIYDSFHMYDKVAAEYDAALLRAPGSHDLTQAAFNANSRIGNMARARDLMDQLESMPEPAP